MCAFEIFIILDIVVFLWSVGACGTRVYAPFRGDELDVRHLKPMFDLGQVGLDIIINYWIN